MQLPLYANGGTGKICMCYVFIVACHGALEFPLLSVLHIITTVVSFNREITLTGDMAEKHKDEITLHNIDSYAVQLLIEYSYTGDVKITEDNVQVLSPVCLIIYFFCAYYVYYV